MQKVGASDAPARQVRNSIACAHPREVARATLSAVSFTDVTHDDSSPRSSSIFCQRWSPLLLRVNIPCKELSQR
jgi:hypothetical protein